MGILALRQADLPAARRRRVRRRRHPGAHPSGVDPGPGRARTLCWATWPASLFGVFMYFPTLVEVPIAKMFLEPGHAPRPAAGLPDGRSRAEPAEHPHDLGHHRESQSLGLCLLGRALQHDRRLDLRSAQGWGEYFDNSPVLARFPGLSRSRLVEDEQAQREPARGPSGGREGRLINGSSKKS
ncbi:MAG: hypothetical protein MZV63_65805 [Marinilabiliales bacterium]|nr:hypothetical protein [Marinilabiliales bacterium]